MQQQWYQFGHAWRQHAVEELASAGAHDAGTIPATWPAVRHGRSDACRRRKTLDEPHACRKCKKQFLTAAECLSHESTHRRITAGHHQCRFCAPSSLAPSKHRPSGRPGVSRHGLVQCKLCPTCTTPAGLDSISRRTTAVKSPYPGMTCIIISSSGAGCSMEPRLHTTTCPYVSWREYNCCCINYAREQYMYRRFVLDSTSSSDAISLYLIV